MWSNKTHQGRYSTGVKIPKKGKTHWLVQTDWNHTDGYHWACLLSMTPSSGKDAGNSSDRRLDINLTLLMLAADLGEATAPPQTPSPGGSHHLRAGWEAGKQAPWGVSSPSAAFTRDTNQSCVLLSLLLSVISNNRQRNQEKGWCSQQYLCFTNKACILPVTFCYSALSYKCFKDINTAKIASKVKFEIN